MRKTIKTYEQVIKNIHRYNEDLPNFPCLQDILSNHSNWYYLATIRKFGPSKFIGYIDMSGQRYTNQRNESGSWNGGDTQKALSKHFVLLDSPKLYDGLVSLLYPYGKTPHCKARFYVPKLPLNIKEGNY